MSNPDSTWMSLVSRRKLLSAFGDGTRDNLSLHRWVLLKNLFTSQQPVESPSSTTSSPLTTPPPPYVYSSTIEEEVFVFPEDDVFVFPDASTIVQATAVDSASAEARWLDELLEGLDDDDDLPIDSCIVPAKSEAPVECIEFSDSSSDDAMTASSPLPHDPADPPSHRPSSPSSHSANLSSQSQYLDDLPLLYSHVEFSSDEIDAGVDEEDSSDDESEGPVTPLALSVDGRQAAATPLVFNETDSYFLYPFERAPISPSTVNFPIYFQEC